MEPQIVISIVTFHSGLKPLAACLESVRAIRLPFLCCVVDNASQCAVRQLCERFAARPPAGGRIDYLPQSNTGFGRAHNVAMSRSLSIPSCRYHLVLNPDIEFAPGAVERLVSFMDDHPDAGAAMPKILYPDGSLQHLCKLLPTPGHLFARRFAGPLAARFDAVYTLRDADDSQVFESPSLSGCFMLLRTDVLRQVGLFDPRFFLYFEDVDLIRRIGQRFKTLYCPLAEVKHGYQKGSYSNLKLLWYHMGSAVRYFNKWGWVCDPERVKVNGQTLNSLPRPAQAPARHPAKV